MKEGERVCDPHWTSKAWAPPVKAAETSDGFVESKCSAIPTQGVRPMSIGVLADRVGDVQNKLVIGGIWRQNRRHVGCQALTATMSTTTDRSRQSVERAQCERAHGL